MVSVALSPRAPMLAGSPHGCTEAIILAHGFTVETLGRLDGLATATRGTVNGCWAADQGDLADDHRRWAAGLAGT
jgi:hypothetical protein